MGNGDVDPSFLSSELDGGQADSRPGRFTTGVTVPVTNYTGDWVDHRCSLDVVVKRKIPNPCSESNSLVIIPTELSWLLTLGCSDS
jgi:hypothetical protein